MKVILSIIFMFLSVQLFSKSPDGKGLACDIETIQNDMQTFDYEKLFFWFEKERLQKIKENNKSREGNKI